MDNQLQVAPKTSSQLQTVDMDQIDQLDNAVEMPIDLVGEYWSPEMPGEEKKVLFERIDLCDVPDMTTGEAIELETAFFRVKEAGQTKLIRNSSKRLVAALQMYKVQRGTALKLVYKGKKRNKTNTYMSDNWAVIPLTINVSSNG